MELDEDEEEEEKMSQGAQMEDGRGSTHDPHQEEDDDDKRKVPKPPPPEPAEMPLVRGSVNTKFCYYNNHGASQPRYLCKRYWTKGGCSRKSKRPRKAQLPSSIYPTQENTTTPPPPLPPVMPNNGDHLHRRLFFNDKYGIGCSISTPALGATNHPSDLNGLGAGTGLEGGGFYGSSAPALIRHGSAQLPVDLRRRLPPTSLFHGNGQIMNLEAPHAAHGGPADSEHPAALLLPAMMGATTLTPSQFGWQHKLLASYSPPPSRPAPLPAKQRQEGTNSNSFDSESRRSVKGSVSA